MDTDFGSLNFFVAAFEIADVCQFFLMWNVNAYIIIGFNLGLRSLVFVVFMLNLYVFVCLGLLYYWAAVSALLCLAVPPKCLSVSCIINYLCIWEINWLIDWLIKSKHCPHNELTSPRLLKVFTAFATFVAWRYRHNVSQHVARMLPRCAQMS